MCVVLVFILCRVGHQGGGGVEVTRVGYGVQGYMGLQQVLLLALAGVVPIKKSLLDLSMLVQAAGLVGEI